MKQLSHEEINNYSHDKQIIIACDGISDKSNIGLITRLSDAFGVKMVIHSSSQSIKWDQKIKRISRSTIQNVEWKEIDKLEAELIKLKESGFEIVALEYCDQSKDLNKCSLNASPNIVIIIGNERYGVSPEVLEISDVAIHIPMFGTNSSMNVTHALAIALNHITK